MSDNNSDRSDQSSDISPTIARAEISAHNSRDPTVAEGTDTTSVTGESVVSQDNPGPPPPVNSPEGTEVAAGSVLDISSLEHQLSGNLSIMAILDTASNNSSSSSNNATNDDNSVEEQAAYHPEQSTWAQDAEDDVRKALMRLAMLAKDEHKSEPSKTVEQLYSERLAQLLKEAEIDFDAKYLT